MTPAAYTKLTGCAPVLLVKDLSVAVNYYQNMLGFNHVDIFGQPPHFAIVRRDEFRVMLSLADNASHVVPNWTRSKGLWDIYFWVDDVDALYMELVNSGATIDYSLSNKPYGCREFGVRDADDHDLGFGQII